MIRNRHLPRARPRHRRFAPRSCVRPHRADCTQRVRRSPEQTASQPLRRPRSGLLPMRPSPRRCHSHARWSVNRSTSHSIRHQPRLATRSLTPLQRPAASLPNTAGRRFRSRGDGESHAPSCPTPFPRPVPHQIGAEPPLSRTYLQAWETHIGNPPDFGDSLEPEPDLGHTIEESAQRTASRGGVDARANCGVGSRTTA